MAARAGAEMLRRGGNAVDAAIASAFTLSVVEPYNSGLGGGGFLLVRDGGNGAITIVDYREKAPASATRDMYIGPDGNPVPGASLDGYRAAGVPGTVAGLCRAAERFARLPLATLLCPAIEIAEHGFPADERYIANVKDRLKVIRRLPATAKILLTADGSVPPWGTPIIQQDLAHTLRRIVATGPEDFYRGDTAALIARDMAANGGLITTADLAGYSVTERDPVRGTYRGYEIVSMPPPSAGGTHLIQMLNILEGFDLKASGYGSVQTIHLMVETMRRAYADRAKYLGDPAFNKVPVAGLTSKAYAAELRASIDLAKATPSATLSAGSPVGYESEQTTHLSAADADGWVAAITQTLNTGFGSCVVPAGTGVILNNEMDDFSSKPGFPNYFGLIGSEANAIAPRKIPLSSMTPTLVLRDGRPFLIAGAPGGSTIINTVLQIIVNVIDHGMDLRMAVEKPKVHHQCLPDGIRVEPHGTATDVLEALRARGHAIIARPTFGIACAIQYDHDGATLIGVPDNRGIGEAVGV